MFGIGPNTFWLDLHGLLMFLILIFAAFLFGAIFFSKEPDARLVRRLKISSAATFILLMLLPGALLSSAAGQPANTRVLGQTPSGPGSSP